MDYALYMDEHVPRAITEGLRRHRALALGRVMFSQGEDFPIEAARRQATELTLQG